MTETMAAGIGSEMLKGWKVLSRHACRLGQGCFRIRGSLWEARSLDETEKQVVARKLKRMASSLPWRQAYGLRMGWWHRYHLRQGYSHSQLSYAPQRY